MFGASRVSTLRNSSDTRIRPNPMPPSRGYHRVTCDDVCRMSDSRSGTTPRIGSCCRYRWSRTVMVMIELRQSLMKRSVPALKMGLLLTALARVRYTRFCSG